MRFLLFSWFLLLSFISILFDVNNTLVHGQCHEDQKSLLIQLKQKLSFSHSATSRLTSWTLNSSSWEGVTCDEVGHVIGLDLSSKSITGGIDNSSSLFELRYIEKLNLANNTFNFTTPIPNGFARLVNLTSLNLSNSGFVGQIPMEISRLTRLVSLDLSTLFTRRQIALKLEEPNLRTLVRDLLELRELLLDGVNISAKGNDWCQTMSKLPNLEVLSLSNCYLSGPFHPSLSMLGSLSKFQLDDNNISAEVPEFFVNFSKLTYLHLSACGLNGTFPEKIFQLPLLQTLDLSINPRLHGWLPGFPQNGHLQNLVLSRTNFSGNLPNSIGNLKDLYSLNLVICGFNGLIPPSMENLSKLRFLDLSSNYFTGPIPSMGLSENLTEINLSHNRFNGSIPSSHWDKLPKLVDLNLRNNSLNGPIPSILFTLPSLKRLDLAHNQFSGQLGEFSNGSYSVLETLDFGSNKLEGPIPSSIFSISSLKTFIASSNNFNGTLGLYRFQNFKNLSSLDLTDNRLSVNINGINPALFPRVGTLKLGSCKLRAFPEFLHNQTTLTNLDLSNNQIRGKIPNWIGKIGNGTLLHLNLSHNFLENPEQPLTDRGLNWLAVVDLHSNLFQGNIPILPPSATFLDYSQNKFTSIIPTSIDSYLSVTVFFSLSGNKFIGEIPLSICKAGYLQVLDLSNNSLTGTIPSCLGSIRTLRVLNLRANDFQGPMPETFPEGCNLRTLDLYGNRLEGDVSRTLANCTMLEVLDLGNNKMTGTFPSWLGGLAQLRVLVLRSNIFHGSIGGRPETNLTFPMLQIIDLSSNNFTGVLSAECFLSWKAMMIQEEESQSKYKHQILRYGFLELSQLYYQDAVTVTIKGLDMDLVKILTVFSSIDLSNNKFEGYIPKAIGDLTSLYLLNLSGNALTGPIPPSLGNLTQLESLDLSRNWLNGTIPMELLHLTFLAVLNLSFNNLVGLIPLGSQFSTFSNGSFEGNAGLCGSPLSKKCRETPKVLPLPTFETTNSTIDFDWQFIAIGLGIGAGMGMVFGPLLFWTKGRKWHDEHISRILLKILPSTKLNYNICYDGRVEAEESMEKEVVQNSGDDADDTEEHEERRQCGRFCVFCSKLDISRKKAIHNANCTCHTSPLNSSSL